MSLAETARQPGVSNAGISQMLSRGYFVCFVNNVPKNKNTKT
ncbi:conserved hypothetical protein [delta proteobacterium NaphS2]|nr:conserved hypothetical protein [delta proteobacterium NaphS2]